MSGGDGRTASATVGLVALVVGLLAAPSHSVAADLGREAFAYIYKVATHPRCLNCHGTYDGETSRPLVGDDRKPHPMNITISHNPAVEHQGAETRPRRAGLGMDCGTCHQDRNLPERGTPPGAPGGQWKMPTDTSMQILPIVLNGALTMEGKQAELCRRWTAPGTPDPEHHIATDPLIKWALTKMAAHEPDVVERLGQALRNWTAWLRKGRSCHDLAR